MCFSLIDDLGEAIPHAFACFLLEIFLNLRNKLFRAFLA